ncbi:MAG TPA: polymer-forming cytoskeletal protein [Pyrinomonadaceae bacterium]|jgi:cytoskeletal protein CcmA (bactofilin family)
MFRTERNSNSNQVAKEALNNQPPPAPAPRQPSASPATDAHAQSQAQLQTATTSRAVSESEALARDIKEGVLNGFVGGGTVFTGEAAFKGMLRVDGRLKGHIASQDGTLIVGTNGQVDADIEVSVATIHGTVNGDIIATKRIEIGRTSKVIGNIQTPALVIEQGAIFEGSCRMLQVKDEADKQQKKEKREAEPAIIAAASQPVAPSTTSSTAS